MLGPVEIGRVVNPRGTLPPPQDDRGTGSRSSVPLAPLFADNPFRLLRLAAGAASAEIRARVEEARIEAELGGGGTLIDQLTRVQVDLLDPARRLRHEILWFYDPPPLVYDDAVDPAQVPGLLDRFRVPTEPSSVGAWQRRHDLALWLLFTAVHCTDAVSTEHFVVRALAAWRDLSTDIDYLGALEDRGYPRSQLAQLTWQTAIDALAVTVRRHLAGNDTDSAEAVARAGVWTGLELDDLRRLTVPGLEVALLDARRALAEARATSPWGGHSDNLLSEEYWEQIFSTIRAWARSLTESLAPIRRLVYVLGDAADRNAREALDDAAHLLRAQAINLVTSLENNRIRPKGMQYLQFQARHAATTINGYWLAHDLLKISMDIAATSDLIQTIRREREIITNRVEVIRTRIQVLVYNMIIKEIDRVKMATNTRDREAIVRSSLNLCELLWNCRILLECGAISIELWGVAVSVLRSVAIDLYNNFSATEQAIDLIDRCILLSPSNEIKMQLESDRSAISRQIWHKKYHRDIANENTSHKTETDRRDALFSWYMSDARRSLESGHPHYAEIAALNALSLANNGSQRSAVLQFLAQLQLAHRRRHRKHLKDAVTWLILAIIASLISANFIF